MRLQDEFPDAIPVRRLPLTYSVQFAKLAGICETLEGPVAYGAGAAVITGTEGEQWPVEPRIFFSTYVPVSKNLAGTDGLYVRLPQTLWACQLNVAMDVVLSGNRGVLHAEPGDWLVEHSSGNRSVVERKIFLKTYAILGQLDA